MDNQTEPVNPLHPRSYAPRSTLPEFPPFTPIKWPSPHLRGHATLLCVLAHSTVADSLAAHWPYYQRSLCPILGVDRSDTRTRWPDHVDTVSIGKETYLADASQARRLLALIEFLLKHEPDYDRFVFIEWDCLFFREMPAVPPLGIMGVLAGGRSPGFHGSRYFHCPWAMSAATAELVLDYGRRLLAADLHEQGFLDRWLGLLCDLYDIPFVPLHGYSQNALDQAKYIAEARSAIQNGAVAVHGIKTPVQLKALTEGL